LCNILEGGGGVYCIIMLQTPKQRFNEDRSERMGIFLVFCGKSFFFSADKKEDITLKYDSNR
jgi:hypothetical protein